MKTLYLHIGTSKTGTTAVQRYLVANRPQLLAQNYAYPLWPTEIEGIRRHRNAHWFAAHGFDENGERVRAIQEKYLAEGFSWLEKQFEQADNVILSDESIYKSAANRKNIFRWKRLREHAKECGYELKVIVYLRRQDEYLMSLYKQKTKNWIDGFGITFQEFYDNRAEHKPDYAEQLNIIAKVLGKEVITVRRYDRSKLLNGDVVADFLDLVGVKVTDEFVAPKVTPNASTSENLSEISRYGMRLGLPENMKEMAYTAAVQASAAADQGYKPTLMSKEQTQALLDEYAVGNAQIAQDYIGDGEPLFSDEIKDKPLWQPNNPYMLQDTVRFLMLIITQQQEHIEKLEKREASRATTRLRRALARRLR